MLSSIPSFVTGLKHERARTAIRFRMRFRQKLQSWFWESLLNMEFTTYRHLVVTNQVIDFS